MVLDIEQLTYVKNIQHKVMKQGTSPEKDLTIE